MRARSSWWIALPVLASILPYLTTLSAGFVWDDTVYLGRWILGQDSLREILVPPPDVYGGTPYYRALPMALSYFCFRVFGTESAWGWHLANVLVHAVSAAGVYFLLKRWTGEDRSRIPAAAIGATAWALWPVHAEPVTWITAHTEEILGAAIIWGVYFHLRARDLGKSGLPAAACFLAALLSKESGVVFVPLALFASFLLPAPPAAGGTTPSWKANLTSALWLPHVLAFAVYTLIRKMTFGRQAGGSLSEQILSKLDPAFLGPAFKAWGYYVREALLLGPGGPYTVDPPADAWPFAVLGIVLVAVATVAVLRKEARPWSLAAFWFVLSLGPPLAVAWQPLSVTAVAIRYLYVPVVGFAAIVALLWQRLPERAVPAAAAAFAAAMIAFGFVIQPRIEPWRDDLSLWSRAVKDEPNRTLPHVNLGLELYVQGRKQEGIDHLRVAAWIVEPGNVLFRHGALTSLADIYVVEGRLDLARVALEKAASMPASAKTAAQEFVALAGLSRLEAMAGKTQSEMPLPLVRKQIALLEQAAAFDDANTTPLLILGLLYEALDEPVRARHWFRKLEHATMSTPALREEARSLVERADRKVREEKDPFRREYALAQEHELEGRKADARAAYERALAIAPDRSEPLVPLALLAAEGGELEKACELLERAAEKTPGHAPIWFNLGLFRLTRNETEGAMTALDRAIELDPEWPKPYFHRAIAFERRGDVPGAIAAWEGYLARERNAPTEGRAFATRRLDALRSGAENRPSPEEGRFSSTGAP